MNVIVDPSKSKSILFFNIDQASLNPHASYDPLFKITTLLPEYKLETVSGRDIECHIINTYEFDEARTEIRYQYKFYFNNRFTVECTFIMTYIEFDQTINTNDEVSIDLSSYYMCDIARPNIEIFDNNNEYFDIIVNDNKMSIVTFINILILGKLALPNMLKCIASFDKGANLNE